MMRCASVDVIAIAGLAIVAIALVVSWPEKPAGWPLYTPAVASWQPAFA